MHGAFVCNLDCRTHINDRAGDEKSQQCVSKSKQRKEATAVLAVMSAYQNRCVQAATSRDLLGLCSSSAMTTPSSLLRNMAHASPEAVMPAMYRRSALCVVQP